MFAILLALAFHPAEAAVPKLSMTPQEQYELGLRYLKRGSYTKALEQFNRVRTYYRDDPVSLKAELAIADMHFRRQEWDAARIAYEDFRSAHPRNADLDFVTYRLGLVLFKKAPAWAPRDQAWTRQAVNTWATFSSRFPDSPYATEVAQYLGKARDRLSRKELVIAKFYRGREAWPAVIGRAEGLLRQYPDTASSPDALALVAEAYAKNGQVDQARTAVEKLRAVAPGHTGIRRAEAAIAKAAASPTP